MDEAGAREILGDCIRDDSSLHSNGVDAYLDWDINQDTACLKGYFFTADQLEAIAWWMRNKKA